MSLAEKLTAAALARLQAAPRTDLAAAWSAELSEDFRTDATLSIPTLSIAPAGELHEPTAGGSVLRLPSFDALFSAQLGQHPRAYWLERVAAAVEWLETSPPLTADGCRFRWSGTEAETIFDPVANASGQFRALWRFTYRAAILRR